MIQEYATLTDKVEKEEVAEFGIGDMQAVILAFVMITIIAVIGLTLTTDFQTDINETTHPDAYAAAGDGTDSISVISGKLGMVALIVVFALIIGILRKYFNS